MDSTEGRTPTLRVHQFTSTGALSPEPLTSRSLISAPTWSCSGVPQEPQLRSGDSAVLGGTAGGMAARALVLEQNSGYSEENLS